MNPPLLIFILNKSKRHDVGLALPAIVAALGRQVLEHLAPTWGRVVPILEFGGEAPAGPGVSQIVILDDPDQADALGYHDETPEGDPYGRVFVRPIVDSGGTVMSGPNSVSVTLSHELLELVGDASANLWADAPDGYSYALELCDAVEGDAYEIDGVSVSNFVFPGFFDPLGASGVRLDYMRRLSEPFAMTEGGYQIRRRNGGKVENIWGKSFPTWKQPAKELKAARRARYGAS